MSIVDSIPLTLGETIGSLMASVIDAQAQAARATVEFIEDVGTLEGATSLDATHELRTVSFRYRKLDENFESKEFVVEIPLLSMVDIPLVTVKNARFAFNYQITRTTKVEPEPEEATPTAVSGSGSSVTLGSMAKPMPIAKPATIVGQFKKQQAATSTSGTAVAQESGGLDVSIELEKASLPIGIDRILDILEMAATERKADDG